MSAAPNQAPAAAPGASEESLPRSFGYWSGHFVVVSSMIGAGIFTTSGFILRDTANAAALISLWIVGGVMALCGALTVAELATRLPRAGGDYLFVREGFGPAAGFLSGWATFVLGFIAPTAVVAHTCAAYLIAPWSSSIDAALAPSIAAQVVPAIASVIVLAVTAVHARGQRDSIRLQAVSTVVKIVILLAFVAVSLASGRGEWRHFSVGGWPTPSQAPLLAVALVYVGYAYSGWNGAGYLAGEIRDPARLLPRCILGGTLTVTAIYLLVNLVYLYALDPLDMTQRTPAEVERVAHLAVTRLFGDAAGAAVASLMGVGMLASVSAFVLAGPRVAFAMARDGAFPAFAARLHPVSHAPSVATWLQGAGSTALLWSGDFLSLLDYASVGLAITSGLMVASVFPIRRRTDLPRGYAMPLYPLPPLLYLALIVWTVAHTLLQPDRRLPALLSIATFALGVPLSWRRRRAPAQ